ncbi:hypothetical protein N7447_008266 [Penicillium robsamsonii]|uniref:uncharacterized protein n=1 Tax=Penicillium robsamsonii TaxID=1792511 RepID=UPI002549A6BB|nr:uncharacterized protein N7447_008266 [Penicillium robsamsonii]KAJ5816033.1 hypothetical protein N7447_008266 [Penicillium robsamsonii]
MYDSIFSLDTGLQTEYGKPPLTQRINAYARTLLEEPYSHSRRVHHIGFAFKRCRFPFAAWDFDETFCLACLLHDIETTEANITRLNFEFFGGVLALRVLQNDTRYVQDEDGADVGVPGRDRGTYTCFGEAMAPREQAKSVEAIIQQDLSLVGSITAVGKLLQLATRFDNIGAYLDLVHADTIKDSSTHFPRKRWSLCSHDENRLKPWGRTTPLGEEFPANVPGNTPIAPYEWLCSLDYISV